jgi:hypothetical protein
MFLEDKTREGRELVNCSKQVQLNEPHETFIFSLSLFRLW